MRQKLYIYRYGDLRLAVLFPGGKPQISVTINIRFRRISLLKDISVGGKCRHGFVRIWHVLDKSARWSFALNKIA